MVDAADMKHWRDAGHVARRTLEAMKDEIKAGAKWHDVIEAQSGTFTGTVENPHFHVQSR